MRPGSTRIARRTLRREVSTMAFGATYIHSARPTSTNPSGQISASQLVLFRYLILRRENCSKDHHFQSVFREFLLPGRENETIGARNGPEIPGVRSSAIRGSVSVTPIIQIPEKRDLPGRTRSPCHHSCPPKTVPPPHVPAPGRGVPSLPSSTTAEFSIRKNRRVSYRE